jgi:hypothetical protein
VLAGTVSFCRITVSVTPARADEIRVLLVDQKYRTPDLALGITFASQNDVGHEVAKMPARLKPIIVRTHRQLRQKSKLLDDWQKLIDERTAEEFERYTARLKRNSQATPVATAHEQQSNYAD